MTSIADRDSYRQPLNDFIETIPVSDIHDSDAEIPNEGILRDALLTSRNEIAPAYASLSTAARRLRAQHRLLINVAALTGTIAITIAILQLPESFHEQWLMPVEALAAIAALIAVAVGIKAARHTTWLLQRYKAEALRTLKFHYVITTVVSRELLKDKQQDGARLHKAVNNITTITNTPLDGLPILLNYAIVRPPSNDQLEIKPDRQLALLIDYYKSKRIAYQLNYFRERRKRHTQVHIITEWITPLSFYGSITAALLHFVAELGSSQGLQIFSNWTSNSQVNVTLLLIAAILPVLGAGMRTVRGANEFARDSSRSKLMEVHLTQLSKSLDNVSTVAHFLSVVSQTEFLLALEHNEWLTLMQKAEWYA